MCLKLMLILVGSGGWNSTVKCRWAWYHYASINPTSKMTRVVLRDLYIVFLNWTKFILYSLLTIPFECCFSWPTRKRWCVCLHVTLWFYEIDIDSRNVVLTIFDLGPTIQYFILRSYVCIVVLNWVLLSFFFWPLCCLSFYDLRILITSLWYLQTLVLYSSFTVPFESPFYWHTWNTLVRIPLG